jgi:hypothetical protein
MNAGAVDGFELLRRHLRGYLAAAGIDALELDLIAGLDAESWRETAVPDRVRWFGA